MTEKVTIYCPKCGYVEPKNEGKSPGKCLDCTTAEPDVYHPLLAWNESNGPLPTRQDVEQMEALLAKYHNQPVRPVMAYCNAIDRYLKAVIDQMPEDDKTRGTVRMLRGQVTKSSFLWRLIYGGEKLRTEKCPIHKGIWHGLVGIQNQCPHYCDLTGWLRNKYDKRSYSDEVDPVEELRRSYVA